MSQMEETAKTTPPEEQPEIPEEQPEEKKSIIQSIHEVVDAPGKPRQWLYDRCDGNERVMNPNSRPCAPCFNAPLPLKWFPGKS